MRAESDEGDADEGSPPAYGGGEQLDGSALCTPCEGAMAEVGAHPIRDGGTPGGVTIGDSNVPFEQIRENVSSSGQDQAPLTDEGFGEMASQAPGEKGEPASTSIERGWVGARARRLGPIEAHVRYLQWVFRCTRCVRDGCWRTGRLRFAFDVARAFGRRHSVTQCRGGANLAGESEFRAQAKLSAEMLDWYSLYVALLRRLQSGRTPFSLQNFCGGGGRLRAAAAQGGRAMASTCTRKKTTCGASGQRALRRRTA